MAVTAGEEWLRESIDLILRHLALQTVSERLEVVLLVPGGERSIDHDLLTAFQPAFDRLRIRPLHREQQVERSLAEACRESGTEIVALLEDHAFPDPGWAERVLEAASEPWSGIACAVTNANPRSTLSRANLLIAYGRWVPPVVPGEVHDLPGHNVVLRRDALRELGDELDRGLRRGGGLAEALRRRGASFYLCDAHVRHVNPSRLSATIALRFHAGRMYGGRRARSEGWSTTRRLVYAAAAPLIPLLRASRELPTWIRTGAEAWSLHVLPALMLALACEALGEATGYLAGSGDAAERLAAFEWNRWRHLTASDRKRILAPVARAEIARSRATGPSRS